MVSGYVKGAVELPYGSNQENYSTFYQLSLHKPAPPPLSLQESALSKYAKKILLAPKPAPVLESMYKDRSQWQLGSLTHAINAEASGYVPLPDFPREVPDKTVRDVEDAWGKTGSGALSRKKKKSEGDFYSSGDDSSEGSDFYSSISGSDESGSEEESGSGSEEGEAYRGGWESLVMVFFYET